MKSLNFSRRQRLVSLGGPNAELALASLGTKLARFGASLALITAVSLVVGHGAAEAYFGHLGAPWIVGLMSPGQLVGFGAKMTLGMAVAAFMTIGYLYGGRSSIFRLELIRNLLVLFSALAALPAFFPYFNWITPNAAYAGLLTSGALAACAFGAAMGELVERLIRSNLRWESMHMALLLAMFAYGLVQAPRGFGLAAAHRDSDPSISELPVVQTGDVASPERAWRLVAVLDKSALLVSLAADPAQRVFRIAPIEELRIVLSHRKAK